MIVKAPGVIKLFGEHAVVYGKLGVAQAIGLYSTANVHTSDAGNFTLFLTDFGKSYSFSRERLDAVYGSYKNKKDINSYLEEQSSIEDVALPYVTIVARIAKEYGVDPCSISAEISSTIPQRKGLASSGSCGVALTAAILGHFGIKLDSAQELDIARDCERVVHKNINAGALDTATSRHGGCVTVSSAQGINKEDIETRLELLLVDTGPKKSTAETVGNVARLYREQREATERTLDEINTCSLEGLKALRAGDIARLGELSFKNQELLRILGVSSSGLDRMVDVSKEHKAPGAKLSGGGGGGVGIVIIDRSTDVTKLTAAFEREGFRVFRCEAVYEGARPLGIKV